jgi:hypothetical protein
LAIATFSVNITKKANPTEVCFTLKPTYENRHPIIFMAKSRNNRPFRKLQHK